MDMINKETGQRGFLLSGKEVSLDPYHQGQQSFDGKCKSFKKSLG